MSSDTSSLRQLHELHQRAKALRDRITSGPKTVAARRAALASRQAKVEEARKSLQDEKVQTKKLEHQVQSLQSKSDDLKVKQNSVRKNEEYKAIESQLKLDRSNIEKVEGQILESMEKADVMASELKSLEVDHKKFADEVIELTRQVESTIDAQKGQLVDLERQIVDAEGSIDEEERDRYRRVVKQRGADALAAVDGKACSGCFVTLTSQVMDQLLTGQKLQFCQSCGRVLYLATGD